MKLVVDASVVVKWFVSEEGQAEALAILQRGNECFAPEHALVEVAGALDKKLKAGMVRRRQVFEALSVIQSHLTMVAGSKLIHSALELASELNHPVADCLYLACAIEIDARVVSADKLFIEKAHARGYISKTILLGSENQHFQTALSISISELEKIESIAHRLETTFKNVLKLVARPSETGKFKFSNNSDLQPAFDSPDYKRLRKHISEMPQENRQDILALCWFGRGYEGDDWSALRLRALTLSQSKESSAISYFVSCLVDLSSGIERLKKLSKSS